VSGFIRRTIEPHSRRENESGCAAMHTDGGFGTRLRTSRTARLTYDPRGVERSQRTDPGREVTPDVHAADIRSVIEAVGGWAADLASRPAPDPAMFGMPTEDDGRRDDLMLGSNVVTVTRYRPDRNGRTHRSGVAGKGRDRAHLVYDVRR
jgi:hypothetical protein